MLYHRANGTFVDTNDSNEAVLSEDPSGKAETDKDVRSRESTSRDWNNKSDIEDADDSEYDKLDNDRDCRESDSSYGTHRADIAMADDTSECRIIKNSGSGESVP
ncbi:hypothetical protein ACHAPF_010884 [Botrytis cinerea]